jgi:DNA-binding transcriptional regulator WhiA
MYSREIEKKKSSLKLTDAQREILIGVILGDAHLETQNDGKTYRVKFEYSLKHREYANHLYEIFREWILTPPQLKQDDTHNNIWFQTVSHGAFRFYAHQFYDDKRKCVPKLIHRYLSNRAIAYWYMDDGSVKSRESKGVIFNTQSFIKNDIERLIKCLRSRFNLETKIREQKDGLQIYISGKSYERFLEIVEPYIHKSMRYKIPVPRSGIN